MYSVYNTNIYTYAHTLRYVPFHFLSNWMGYYRGDSIWFHTYIDPYTYCQLVWLIIVNDMPRPSPSKVA